MSFNPKRKVYLAEPEWAGLVNSRQQLEQSLAMEQPWPGAPLSKQPEELDPKRDIVQQQAAEISRLRAQVRHLQAQLATAPVAPEKNAPVILTQAKNWAELTPAWQNGDLGIRPWQAEPIRSQRRGQVELPQFARR